MNKHLEDCEGTSITINEFGGNAICDSCKEEFEPYWWRSQPDGFYETENQINQTKENK